MQMNMMCARREFKDAQQRFDHMTMVINSYLEGGEAILFDLSRHIVE
ncbi:RNA polymerase subunit sigma, partial [Acinetobacter baumannii]|nr:RNA polymerase subunit sigma [Acinetobacter baumannii]